MNQSLLTVLIAEDEFVNFFFLKALLEKLDGIQDVIHAENGEKAVEICKNNPHINLILMDIKMPEMNGFEAIQLIKEFRPNVPFIFQSAYATQEVKDEAKNLGCVGFLTKPISIELFNALVRKYIT